MVTAVVRSLLCIERALPRERFSWSVHDQMRTYTASQLCREGQADTQGQGGRMTMVIMSVLRHSSCGDWLHPSAPWRGSALVSQPALQHWSMAALETPKLTSRQPMDQLSAKQNTEVEDVGSLHTR